MGGECQIKLWIFQGCWGVACSIMCSKQKNFSWVWRRDKNFLLPFFEFFESKKFFTQGVCMLKFLFLGGWWGNVLAIMCKRNGIFIWQCRREINFFTVLTIGKWSSMEKCFWQFLVFESKKILASFQCKIKIWFLEGC